MSTKNFALAILDYRYLKEKGFPEKGSLKLVGDRYRLSKVGRNCLFRGVADARTAEARRRKIAMPEAVRGSDLGIDWYNVLITVESYLGGALLFLSDDGLLRDASGTHGSYHRGTHTPRALQEILAALRALSPRRVDVFLDSPIARSAEMAGELREALAGIPQIVSEVSLAHTADFPLKAHRGLVATSDSVVLDAAGSVFDLARHVLEGRFSFTPPRLEELALRTPGGPGRLLESGSPGS
jgi:hypothetical protein